MMCMSVELGAQNNNGRIFITVCSKDNAIDRYQVYRYASTHKYKVYTLLLLLIRAALLTLRYFADTFRAEIADSCCPGVTFAKEIFIFN